MPTCPPFRPHAWRAALTSAACAFVLAGCATPEPVRPPVDGGLALPAGYATWPRFLSTIDKEAAKQVREIYMNPAATQGTAAAGFPHGSQFVMEIYAAAAMPDGTLKKDAQGRLEKGPLSQVFMMAKGPGWGQDVPEAQRNGEWVYTAFAADGTPKPGSAAACRACHLPQKANDYVIHAERYHAMRAAAPR